MKKKLILIFGMTGDLARRKLLPAIYQLLATGKLDQIYLVGAAIEAKTEAEILEPAKAFIPNLDLAIWQKLVASFRYCQVDINQESDFERLAQTITQVRVEHHLSSQILVYCAVFESLYGQLTQQLARVGIIRRQSHSDSDWCRVVYEKPFGNHHASVAKLNQLLLSVLDEAQIYRIDHYLAKTAVSNLLFVRFTNKIFQSLWNNHSIESIQIVLDEALDIEQRGDYYDRYGVMKDMVQNHVLQLIALLAMREPKNLGADLPLAKAEILQKIQCEDLLLGQYIGYCKANGVQKTSQTPTFAALKFAIDDPRWYGVPFYVRTGKMLRAKSSKIVIKFKDVHCLLTKNCPPPANTLTFLIYPHSEISFLINSKKPNVSAELTNLAVVSHYQQEHLEGYAQLLDGILQGQSNFALTTPEIEAAWQIIDQIEKIPTLLCLYVPHSNGPVELELFNNKHQLTWI